MSSQNYRDRLALLEKELYEPNTSPMLVMMSTYRMYLFIILFWFIVLVAFTPSFLYTAANKKKNQPAERAWIYIIFVWLILSSGSGAGYYYWNAHAL